MARIRTIKPEFWEDNKIGSCHPMARLMFICLLNYADDAGNYIADPKAMRRNCFGYDDDINSGQVQEWLDELAAKKLICYYEVDDEKFLHIKNFTKHQRIEKPAYKYPPFESHTLPAQKQEVSSSDVNHDTTYQPTFPEPVCNQSETSLQLVDDQSETSLRLVDEQSTLEEYSKGKDRKVKESKGKQVVTSSNIVLSQTEQPPDAITTRSGQLAKVFHSAGIRVNPGDPRLRKWAENGLPEDTVRSAIDLVLDKKPGKTYRFEYFIPIIEDWQRQADGMKAGTSTKPIGKAINGNAFQQQAMENARKAAKMIFGDDYDTSAIS